MTFKVVRNFIDKKTGLPHAGEYGCATNAASAAEVLRKVEKNYPGYKFEITEIQNG